LERLKREWQGRDGDAFAAEIHRRLRLIVSATRHRFSGYIANVSICIILPLTLFEQAEFTHYCHGNLIRLLEAME
jgi:hypothetical protein